MKTPRDILLQRHQATEPKLDRIRETIVSDLHHCSTAREDNFPITIILKLWRELVLPCRRTWAGLAVVWLVITVFNLMNAGSNPQIAASSPTQSAEMRIVFQEQQRVLAELVGQAQPAQPAVPSRRDENQPRSEVQSPLLAA